MLQRTLIMLVVLAYYSCFLHASLPIIPGAGVLFSGYDVTSESIKGLPLLKKVYNHNLQGNECSHEFSELGVECWHNAINKQSYLLPILSIAVTKATTTKQETNIIIEKAEEIELLASKTVKVKKRSGFLGRRRSTTSTSKTLFYKMKSEDKADLSLTYNSAIIYELSLIDNIDIRLLQFLLPELQNNILDPHFQKSIEELPLTFDPSNETNQEIFFSFISTFGTEFITSVKMGGLTKMVSWFQECMAASIEKKDKIVKKTNRGLFKILTGYKVSKELLHEVNGEYLLHAFYSMMFKGGDSKKFSTFEWDEWANSVNDYPVPIEMDTIPITELLYNYPKRKEALNLALDEYEHQSELVSKAVESYYQQQPPLTLPLPPMCTTSRATNNNNNNNNYSNTYNNSSLIASNTQFNDPFGKCVGLKWQSEDCFWVTLIKAVVAVLQNSKEERSYSALLQLQDAQKATIKSTIFKPSRFLNVIQHAVSNNDATTRTKRCITPSRLSLPLTMKYGVGFDSKYGQCKQSIIQATCYNNKEAQWGKKVINVPDQINLVTTSQNGFTLQSTGVVITNLTAFLDFQIQVKLSLSINLFSLLMPPIIPITTLLVDAAGAGKIESGLAGGANIIFSASTTYYTTEAIMYPYGTLKHQEDSSFTKAINELPIAYNATEYQSFINKFGTSFISKGRYGAAIRVFIQFPTSLYLQGKAGAEAKFRAFWMQLQCVLGLPGVFFSGALCGEVDVGFMSHADIRIVVQGAALTFVNGIKNKNFEFSKWMSQAESSPVLLDYEIKPYPLIVANASKRKNLQQAIEQYVKGGPVQHPSSRISNSCGGLSASLGLHCKLTTACVEAASKNWKTILAQCCTIEL